MNYIYHGNSMKRVFQAGDVPELREFRSMSSGAAISSASAARMEQR